MAYSISSSPTAGNTLTPAPAVVPHATWLQAQLQEALAHAEAEHQRKEAELQLRVKQLEGQVRGGGGGGRGGALLRCIERSSAPTAWQPLARPGSKYNR